MKKKVFINIKESVRERHWDTYREAKKLFDVVDVQIKQHSSVKIYKKNESSMLSKVKGKIVENLDLINYQNIVNVQDNIDMVYVWGSIPKNINKPFIIELDNPYVLAYYNKNAFFNKKDKIKKELERADKITFLSSTAKNHFIELMGKKFEQKCFVNYPFMKKHYLNNKRVSGVISFLFVGLDFRGKGGLELLEAFSNVKDANIRLIFISNVPTDIKNIYAKDSRIEILEPQSREKLFNYYYPKSDIFIFPTMYESFGVVLLEALSFGMGIITTNVYATHEMVKNNGVLLHHPFLKTTQVNGEEIINCLDYRIGQFQAKYLRSEEFYYSVYFELKNSIETAVNHCKEWQENSMKLYEKKFSEEKWKENFYDIINADI